MEREDVVLYTYRADVLRVVDGDTIDVMLDYGMKRYAEERLRLYGINAPEMRGQEKDAGIAARDALERMIGGKRVIIRTIEDKKGKYGRYLAKVWADAEPGRPLMNINDAMVSYGFAALSNYR